MAASSSSPPVSGTSAPNYDTRTVHAWLDLSYPKGRKTQIGPTGDIDEIIAQIHPYTASIDLSGHKMGKRKTVQLVSKLRENSSLVSLNLSGNDLSIDDEKKVYEALFKKTSESIIKSYRNGNLCYIIINHEDHHKPPSMVQKILSKYEEKRIDNIVNSIACLAYILFYSKIKREKTIFYPLIQFVIVNRISHLTFYHPELVTSQESIDRSLRIGSDKIKITYENELHVRINESSIHCLLNEHSNIPLFHLFSMLDLSKYVEKFITLQTENNTLLFVNAIDGFYRTALSYAVSACHLETVNCLLSSGGSPVANLDRSHILASLDQTPLCLAYKVGKNIFQLLLSYWKTSASDFEAWKEKGLHIILLQYFIQRIPQIAEIIIDVSESKNLDAFVTPGSPFSPLHFAILSSEVSTERIYTDAASYNKVWGSPSDRSRLMKMLIEKIGPKSINFECPDGSTPLTCALYYRDYYTAHLILNSQHLQYRNRTLHNSVEYNMTIEHFVVSSEWDDRDAQILLVQEIVEKDIRIEEIRDSQQKTPLHYALSAPWKTREHQVKIIDTLLKFRGWTINLQDPAGMTPLHNLFSTEWMNSKQQQRRIIKTLLDRNADLTIKDSQGHTPLDVAQANGYIDFELLQIFLRKRLPINKVLIQILVFSSFIKDPKDLMFNSGPPTVSNASSTHLSHSFTDVMQRVTASHEVSPEIIRQINQNIHGIGVESRSTMILLQGFVASTEWEDWSNQILIIKNVFSDGFNINGVDSQKQTPLHYVVAAPWNNPEHQIEVINILLTHPRPILDFQDSEGRTPLHNLFSTKWINSKQQQQRIIKILLDKSVNCSIKNTEGETPLDIAHVNGYLDRELLQFFQEKNLPISEIFIEMLLLESIIKDSEVTTSSSRNHPGFEEILQQAINHGESLEILKQISDALSSGADIDSPIARMLLQQAVSQGHFNILKTLTEAGANLNRPLDDGKSLLTLALESIQEENPGQVDIVKYLVINELMTIGLESFLTKDYLGLMCSSTNTEVRGLGLSLQTASEIFLQAIAAIRQAHMEEIEKLNAIVRAHEEAIQKIFALLHVGLLDKIKSFLTSEYGEYFRCFHDLLLKKFTSSLDGMRVTLSKWVSSTKPTSAQAIEQTSKAIKGAVPLPGVSVTAAAGATVAEKRFIDAQKDRLKAVSSLFPTSTESNLFVLMLSSHLMEILEPMLILIDKMNEKFLESSSEGKPYCVHEKAMQRLVDSLFIRISDFMFVKHFHPDQPWSFQDETSIYRYARNVALSFIWYQPDSARIVELFGENPIGSTRIVKLPTQQALTFLQKTKIKISDIPNRLGISAMRLYQSIKDSKKRAQKIPKIRRRILTDQGCFQKAPIIAGEICYGPRKQYRPKKYPPLIVSQKDVTHIQMTSEEEYGTASLARTSPYNNEIRETLSYRELFEQQNQNTPLPFSSSSSAASSSHNPHSVSVLPPISSEPLPVSSSSSSASSSSSSSAGSSNYSSYYDSSNTLPPISSASATFPPSSSGSPSTQFVGQYAEITATFIPESDHIQAIRSEFQCRIDSLTNELNSMKKRIYDLEERLHLTQGTSSQMLVFSPEAIHRIIEEKFREMRRELYNSQHSHDLR